jgi:YidC/Oxa1 family membrane protein insertase
MSQPRVLLWAAFLLLLWLNFEAWRRDYAPDAPPPPPATETGAEAPAEKADEFADYVPEMTRAAPGAAGETAGVPETTAAAGEGPGTIRIVTDVLDVEVSLAGAEFVRADLPQYPRHKDEPSTPVRLFNTDSKDTRFLFQSGLTSGKGGRSAPNHNAVFSAPGREFRLEAGGNSLEVPLAWSDGAGLTVTKTLAFRRGSYEVGVRYHVENAGTTPVQLASYAQLLRHSQGNERSMWDPETYSFRGPAYYDGDSYQTLDIDDEDEQSLSLPVTNGWVAALQHHFVAAIVPVAGQPYEFGLAVKDQDFRFSVVGPAQTVPAGGSLDIEETLFVGPKLQDQLEAIHPELDRSVDYGMLWLLAKPMFWIMSRVDDFVGNWGFTIIIVTFLIKLVFYKLSETSGRSMAKMKTVAPRLKALQERHKDDREAQARAMMELYKREKINPVAGCLPVLVQIPFFLAFYWVLLESVEMRQAPFVGWIQDLSSRDPYFILPILMGGAMFLQFKLNPTPPDPVQAKVFAFMPVIMTVMFLWFPSGLVLYWLTNTLLSIAQQWKINRVVEAEAKKHRGG